MDNRYTENEIQENKHGILFSMIIEWRKRFFPDEKTDTDEEIDELTNKILDLWNGCIERGWRPQPLGFYKTNDNGYTPLENWVVLERITDKNLQSGNLETTLETPENLQSGNYHSANENGEKVRNMLYIKGLQREGTISPLGSPMDMSVPSHEEGTCPLGDGFAITTGRSPVNHFRPQESFKGRKFTDILEGLDGVFDGFESLASLRMTNEFSDCIQVGFDTEFYYIDETKRFCLSFQFAYLDRDSSLHEVIMIPTNKDIPLKLEYVFSYILNSIGIESLNKDDKYWKVDVNTPEESRKKYFMHNQTLSREGKITKICLICHFGMADLTCFANEQNEKGFRVKSVYTNFFRYVSQVNKGITTISNPLIVGQKDYSYAGVCRNEYFNVSLLHRDTMTQTVGSTRSLADCGKIIGLEKLEVTPVYKEHMDVYFNDDFYSFLEYGSNDSLITLFYFMALYGGYNKGFPTITGLSGRVLMDGSSEVLGIPDDCSSKERQVLWDRKYRGLEMTKKGLEMSEDGRLFEREGYTTITHNGKRVNQMSEDCYKGGCNESFIIGKIEGERTYDIDGENCYPTAMCLLPLIDWEHPFDEVIFDRDMNLRMFTDITGLNPIRPGFFFVRFEFPEDVYEPCLGITDYGNCFYPRTSEGVDGTYATSTEVFLALKLGAKVHCVDGFFCNYLLDPETQKPISMFSGVLKKLVQDRTLAQSTYGKKSLVDLLLKVAANGSYGKIAQSVRPKTTWNAYSKTMDDLGCSFVTHSVYASMITGIVRCQVKAAINQLHELNYKVYSVTTDGFITNAPIEVVQSLDLYGLAPLLQNARFFLTSDENNENGDPTVWSVKHEQDTLINLTTRANVGLEPTGVLAHGGYKTQYPSDSPEDRAEFVRITTSRTKPTEWECLESTNLKDYVERGIDFHMKKTKKTTRFDFDMKRKPVPDSRYYTEHDGHEICTFDSKPYENINEAKLYKETARQFTKNRVLRTFEDWESFDRTVINGKVSGSAKILDRDTVVRDIVYGHYQGLWTLPALASAKNPQERIDFINRFRTKPVSKETLKKWPSRSVGKNIPPRESLEPYLSMMINNRFDIEKEED